MTEHDRDDTFDWVARAYADTPIPSTAAREQTIAAARAAIKATSHETASLTSDVTPISTYRRFRWMPMITLLAAACVMFAWWKVLQHSDRKSTQTAIAEAGAPAIQQSREQSGSSSAVGSADVVTQSGGNTSVQTTAPTNPNASVGSPVYADNTGSVTNRPQPAQTTPFGPSSKHQPNTPASIPPAPPSIAPQVATAPHLPASTPTPASALDGLDAESTTLVTGILDSAKALGLPTAPLISRVREGIRRRVPGPRIVVVVRNYADALANAKSALGESATAGELQSGAEALLAGTPVSALRQPHTNRKSNNPGSLRPTDGSGRTLPTRDSASTH